MIVALSLRTLVRRRSRTILALAGIAVSAALLLDMTMLASGLTTSFAELTRAQGYPYRVTPEGTLPFDSEAGIRDAGEVRAAIQGVPGIRAVAPVLGAQLYLGSGASSGEPIFTTGIDPAAQMLYLLVDGGEPRAGEVVVSEPLAEAYQLQVGDSIELAPELDVALGRPRGIQEFRVSGIGEFLYDYAGQRSLAISLAQLQRMTGRPDEISLFAVAPEAGVDEEALSERIAASTAGISVYSTRELMAAMDQRLLYFRQLSTILGTIALAVAALLVGTIVTIGVRERFGEIATLRAIGISGRRLQLGIVVEGVALTTAGCLLGIPIGLWMAGRLDRILLAFPGIPSRVSFFVLDPLALALAMSMVILVGALVGIVPGAQALRAPLGRTLREEAD
ncbi:MAG: ABC transporter permease [Gemmatimonadota bacterium]